MLLMAVVTSSKVPHLDPGNYVTLNKFLLLAVTVLLPSQSSITLNIPDFLFHFVQDLNNPWFFFTPVRKSENPGFVKISFLAIYFFFKFVYKD